MNEIVILSEETKNKLSAGEVVERPASVVKELIENSVDANANFIDVDIQGGGINKIKVYDTGKGVLSSDVEIAFYRHATSKIKSFEDIFNIQTLGFRGEALSAIASVSKVSLTTRHFEESIGTYIYLEGGIVKNKRQLPFEKGTLVEVNELFYNTPARLKFLKSSSTELKYCIDAVEKCALANVNISFKISVEGKQYFYTPGDNKISSAILAIYGIEIYKNLLEINYQKDDKKIYGFITDFKLNKANRNGYNIFVNRRPVKSRIITAAIDEVNKLYSTSGRYPIIFLYIDLPPQDVDVNVHPAKLEVKFRDEREIYNVVYKALLNALNTSIVSLSYSENVDFDKSFENHINCKKNTNNYTQNQYQLKINEITSQFDDLSNKQIKNYSSIINDDIDKASSGYKICGYLFDTYIIVEKNNKLYMIDQHAVHEKSIYNRLSEMFLSKSIKKQYLLMPITLEVSHSVKMAILEKIEIFDYLGFEIEDFGGNSIIIRSQPYLDKNFHKYIELNDIIDILNSEYISLKSDYLDNLLKRISCILAVKSGNKLNEGEMEYLISLAFQHENMFCPHGRPAIVEIEKQYIERLFRRT